MKEDKIFIIYTPIFETERRKTQSSDCYSENLLQFNS